MSKKIIGKKPLPLKAGDKVKCIAKRKLPTDNYNFMDEIPKVQLGKTYVIDYITDDVYEGIDTVILKGANAYMHRASNFKKVRTVKK